MWVCEFVEEEGSRFADWEAKAEHFVGRTANMLATAPLLRLWVAS